MGTDATSNEDSSGRSLKWTTDIQFHLENLLNFLPIWNQLFIATFRAYVDFPFLSNWSHICTKCVGCGTIRMFDEVAFEFFLEKAPWGRSVYVVE